MLLRLVLALHLAGAQVPEPPDVPVTGVQWSAPAGCPGRAELLSAISRRLGRELAPDELALDARVLRDGPRHALRLRLVVGDRSELRELTADTCAPLVDATALLVAHTLAEAASEAPPVPIAEALAQEPEPAPEPIAPPPPPITPPPPPITPPPLPITPPPPPITPPPPPITPPPPPITPPPPSSIEPPTPASRPRGPGVLLRAHGGPELGAAPRLTGLAGLAVGLLWPRLRLEARASFLAPRSVTRGDTEVAALLLAGSLHACARLGRGALELPLCGGLELGGMRGAASGPGSNQAAYMPWLGVVLGVGVAWRVHPRLALWSALEAVGGLVRPNFVLRDPGPDIALFHPAPASGRLLLGLELRFGDPR